MRGTIRGFAVSFALLLVSSTGTVAVDLNKSRLSTIDLKACRQPAKHPDGGAWLCPGLRGFPIYFAEGDLRHMLGFGPSPQKRTSSNQTLQAFNTIFDGKRRPTVEWRVESDARGRIVPFATIVRFHTSLDNAKGDVLVVTKVDAKDSCQLAVIDATANPDAMAIARMWAIAEAKKQPCPGKPIMLGKVGKGPM
jgi:hypothetical protein